MSERGLNRRRFLQQSATWSAGALAATWLANSTVAAADEPLFKISLAQWSLHRAIPKTIDPLDFALVAKKDYGIDAIEYVNQFYFDKAKNTEYLGQLKKRAEDNGVKSVLIMCDRLGNLGDADEAKRKTAVENHYPWVEAAKFLGCHSIRVNAASSGTYEEQVERAADGLHKLTEFATPHEINVIVENHGGLSSNGEWLATVMKKVNLPRCGTLPDFGNFNLGNGKKYDNYKGVEELMPFAKAVSAKSYDFNEQGDEKSLDYVKLMRTVLKNGYRGYVGIEYEGGRLPEPEGILATKKLLEKVRDILRSEFT